MQNFRGLCRRGWSGQIASLTHESSHLWTHPHAQYIIIRRSRQGSAFLGISKMKFEI